MARTRGGLDLDCGLMTVAVTLMVAVMMTLVPSIVALANCPNGCQCNDDTLVVRCGEGHLDVLPIALNPSIQRLVIKNNKIKTIDSSMQFYAEITFLDLSYNHLSVIPSHTFMYQKKMQELHLNHNKLSIATNRTFIGLDNLTVLNLRGNFLEDLNAGVLMPMPNLRELNLGQNRISRIDAHAFAGLAGLRVLYLDDNALTAVPSAALTSLPSLAELFVGLNSFTTLARGSFASTTGLSRLDLRGAALVNITVEAFRGLDGLRIIDLSDNRLQRVPTAELSTLGRLEELTVGQNDFDVIVEGAFVGLVNLRRLDITGSLRLQKIEAGAFATNTNLESITIASNEALTEMQEGALSGLPRLRHLILHDNALVTLAEGLFPWHDLNTLDLSNNPFACDCRLVWLRALLAARNTTSVAPVLCATPERLRDEALRTLSPELLGCSHIDPERQTIICVVFVAGAAMITTLALFIYRGRHRIRDVLKGSWGSSALGRKEREYQKTFSDEDYMSRHAHPCSLSVHSSLAASTTYPTAPPPSHHQLHQHQHPHQHQHQHQQQHHHAGLRPIPVTEL